jgi:hypothetical protein
MFTYIVIVISILSTTYAWVAYNEGYPERKVVSTAEIVKQIEENPRLPVKSNFIGPHLRSINQSYEIHFKCDDLFKAIITASKAHHVRIKFYNILLLLFYLSFV